jgi:hypothetical protein
MFRNGAIHLIPIRGLKKLFSENQDPRWKLDIDYWILDIEQRLLDIEKQKST